MQFKSMLNELDGEVGYFLRVAGTADRDARIDFTSETGAKWKRSVYDIKRVGVDRSSSTQVSRMVVGTAKLSKRFAMLGKVAIAVSVGDSAVEIGKVCSEHGFGKVCYATAGVEAGGIGIGVSVGTASEIAAEKWLTTGFCNLLFDAETFGGGVIACQFIVNAGAGVAGAYYSSKYTKIGLSTLLSSIYPNIGVHDE